MKVVDVFPILASISLSLISVVILILRIFGINRSKKRYLEHLVALISITLGLCLIVVDIINNNLPNAIAPYYAMNVAAGGSILIWSLLSKQSV